VTGTAAVVLWGTVALAALGGILALRRTTPAWRSRHAPATATFRDLFHSDPGGKRRTQAGDRPDTAGARERSARRRAACTSRSGR
jgi:hypothetical protein